MKGKKVRRAGKDHEENPCGRKRVRMGLVGAHKEQQLDDQTRVLKNVVTRHDHLERARALPPSRLYTGESEGGRAQEKSKKEERRTHSDNAAELEGTAGGEKRNGDRDDHLRAGLSD